VESVFFMLIRRHKGRRIAQLEITAAPQPSLDSEDMNVQYFSASEGESDEQHTLLLPGLPNEVVLTHLWPRIMKGASAQSLCHYRLVHTRWREIVDNSHLWHNLRPFLVGIDRIPPWATSGLDINELMYMPPYLVFEYHRQTDSDALDASSTNC